MKIVSIVPIKLNNERLPGKNIKILGNKPLIKYILNTIDSIDLIDESYVYCSDETICDYIDGKTKFLKRDESLDLPSANFTQIFERFMNEIDADVYVYAHATAPFISKDTIEKQIKSVVNGEFDSSFTAEKIQDFIWSNDEPLNFDAKNVPRSQDLPVLYRETSGVYVFTKDVFKKYKRRIGIKPNIIEVNQKEMIDINYPEDFQLATKMLEKEDLEKYPKRIKLLDCTLRDGGCVNKFDFGTIAMEQIKNTLNDSFVDIIELGYIDDINGSKNEKTKFIDVESVNNFIGTKKKETKYVVMADYGKFDFNNLPVRSENGIDGVRLAFHKKDYKLAIEAAKLIEEKGYDLYIQPMIILSYTDNEIIDLVKMVNNNLTNVYAFYIVDSFGQMKYGDCSRLLRIVNDYLDKDIRVGFHGHNNLQLAYSNALELISNDVDREMILDCSLNGMGKGAGNVPTELIMNYLNTFYKKTYNLKCIYKIINDVINDFKNKFVWGYSIKFLLSALNGCTPSYVDYFMNKCHIKEEELSNLLAMLDSNKKIAFDEKHGYEIYMQYNKSKNLKETNL